MKALSGWYEDYRKSHCHPVNRTLNWFCIPQTVFAIWLGLKCVPVGNHVVNLATLAALGTLMVYFRLSRPLALGMLVILSGLYFGVMAVEAVSGPYSPWLALAIFAEAWASQLIGRDVAGARPTFTEDLRFLLIGPLWLLADIYTWLNWPLRTAGDESAAV